MKTLVVFGTRPEAIKMAPIIAALTEAKVEVEVCVTSQHRQMLDQVLQLFNIAPHYDLNVMKEGQSLFELTENIIREMRAVLTKSQPDIVLVQGDTTTAFAASLAAFYAKIKIGHVEAGLRTYNKYNPFPEEMNRKLISSLADLHFAPTSHSKKALIKEGISKNCIVVTGNTSIDALLMTLDRIRSGAVSTKILDEIPFVNKRFILVTAHRRESFGEGLVNICEAIAEIARRNKEVDIVCTVHLNPNVQSTMRGILSGIERVHLIAPQDYVSFVVLMNASYLILTDSGGIQEEAPSLGKPVLVLRETTERIEAIQVGAVKLVGTDTVRIIRETETLLRDPLAYASYTGCQNPYGDGNAAQIISRVVRATPPQPVPAEVHV